MMTKSQTNIEGNKMMTSDRTISPTGTTSSRTFTHNHKVRTTANANGVAHRTAHRNAHATTKHVRKHLTVKTTKSIKS